MARLVCLVLTVIALGAASAVAPATARADGIAIPAPYRWVSPPPNLAANNQSPASGQATVAFTGGVSDPASAFTDDGQVTISLEQGALTSAAGQTAVQLRITPVRPQPSAPRESAGDGNAYLVQASYVPSGQPASLTDKPALLDIRYPIGHRPDDIYRIAGGSWTALGATPQVLLLTIDVGTLQLGTFIAGHRALAPASSSQGLKAYLLPIAFVVAVGALLLIAGVRVRRAH